MLLPEAPPREQGIVSRVRGCRHLRVDYSGIIMRPSQGRSQHRFLCGHHACALRGTSPPRPHIAAHLHYQPLFCLPTAALPSPPVDTNTHRHLLHEGSFANQHVNWGRSSVPRAPHAATPVIPARIRRAASATAQRTLTHIWPAPLNPPPLNHHTMWLKCAARWRVSSGPQHTRSASSPPGRHACSLGRQCGHRVLRRAALCPATHTTVL